MDPSASTLEAYDQANALYWGSDKSVNQIAEDLDLSKGALYGMIRPLAAAMGCPDCGAEVVHPNRTARDRRLVDCPACGWDGPEQETEAGYEIADLSADGRVSRRQEGGSVFDAYLPSEPNTRVLVGGALLGAAVGLALVLWARRR